MIPQVRDKILKKVKKSKKWPPNFEYFPCFCCKNTCFSYIFEGMPASRACPLRGRARFAGAPPPGARPFGARWAGPPLPGVERKYWKSSQEKVSRKTTLYFLEKTFKTLWNLSRTTDLVERIRMQFFSSKIDWKSLELWHFFSILHFIYFLPIFQFLVYALPIRFWQVLMKSKNPKVKISNNFVQPFILYGKAIVFNFGSMPSL